MKAYHFTTPFALAGIVQDGIAHGEVAITPVHVLDFPWFTAEFSREAQADWTCGNDFKSTLRLEVELRCDDQRLVRWRDYAKRLSLRDAWYRQVTGPQVARNGRTWFVYRGIVPFDSVTDAYFFPCRERVSSADLRQAAEILAPLNIESSPALPCRHLTEQEALCLSHNEQMAAYSAPLSAALQDVAQHRALRHFCSPRAASFLEWVRGAGKAYQAGRLADAQQRAE